MLWRILAFHKTSLYFWSNITGGISYNIFYFDKKSIFAKDFGHDNQS